MSKLAKLLMMTGALLAASQLHAAEIWDEADDGDLANSFYFAAGPAIITTPTAVGALTLGTNTLLGESPNTTAPNETDFDGAKFTIDAGKSVDSLSVTFNLGVRLIMTDGSANLLPNFGDDQSFASSASPLDLLDFMGVTSLGAGDYNILIRNGSGVYPSALEYEFTFNLVPEPTTVCLLGLATSCLLLTRRRRYN